MTDEALKELLAKQNTTTANQIPVPANRLPKNPQFPGFTINKEAPVPSTSAIKKWFVIHPKVKAAALVAAGVAFVAFDNAYNGGETYRQAFHDAGGGILVLVGSYLGKNKPTA